MDQRNTGRITQDNLPYLITGGDTVRIRMSNPVKIITGCNQKYCVRISWTVIHVMTVTPEYREKAQDQYRSAYRLSRMGHFQSGRRINPVAAKSGSKPMKTKRRKPGTR